MDSTMYKKWINCQRKWLFCDEVKKKRRHEEADHQKAIFSWLNLYPELRQYVFHIPNGGRRSKFEGRHLKLEGVTPGIYDNFLAYPSGIYHGFFFEMKAPGKIKNLSEAQLKKKKIFEAVGYKCAEFDNWFKARDGILEYLGDNKIRFSLRSEKCLTTNNLEN